jgi:hypothetical protein
MLKFIKRLFSKKKEDFDLDDFLQTKRRLRLKDNPSSLFITNEPYIKRDTKINFVSSVCNKYFCIQTSDVHLILNLLDINYKEEFILNKEIDWDFLSDLKNDNINGRLIIFEPIDGWVYILCNFNDNISLDYTRKFIDRLAKELKTTTFYFFIDLWCFCCDWILANENGIYRVYSEEYNKIIFQEGNCEIENDVRNTIFENLSEGEEEYWEYKYWNFTKRICQSIDVINDSINLKAYKVIFQNAN